ncbi:hypothetical protein Mapa_001988 [Marchantia paleacea]|nr:hypothetical protein Mapa_001988 [Marchantia paleacea]
MESVGTTWTVLFLGLTLFTTLHLCDAELPNLNFYQKTCGQAPIIVAEEVRKLESADPAFAGPFIRLHFHDCWARVRRVGVIDQIKAAVEAVWLGVVSCADIVALAAPDAVVKVGGPSWPVILGRKDGVVSSADEANVNLPFPVLNFTQLVQNFATKNLKTPGNDCPFGMIT